MPRHARYVPHGVIPAVLLPFNDDLSIDVKSFRAHLRDVAATKGISAITINAHSTEVGSLTFDEQRRVLAIAQDEIGERVPLVNGVSGVNSLVARRMVKKQQMQWSKRGAHLLLQVRATVLNVDLRERRAYKPPKPAHRSRIAWMFEPILPLLKAA